MFARVGSRLAVLCAIFLTSHTLGDSQNDSMETTEPPDILAQRKISSRLPPWPFMVALYEEGSEAGYFCAGTLLRPSWVLTAGFCVSQRLAWWVFILAGTTSADKPNSIIRYVNGMQRRWARRFVTHPDLTVTSKFVVNDLALVEANRRFYTGPLDLVRGAVLQEEHITSPENPFEKIKCTLVGWASENKYLKLGSQVMPTITERTCRQAIRPPLHNKTWPWMCTAPVKQKSQCVVSCLWGSHPPRSHADGGSPIICNQKVVGVVSRLADCSTEYPSALMRVDFYADWINDVMNGVAAPRHGETCSHEPTPIEESGSGAPGPPSASAAVAVAVPLLAVLLAR